MNDLYDSNQYFGDYQMNSGSQNGNQGPAMPYGNQEPAMPYGDSSQMQNQTYGASTQQSQTYGVSSQAQNYGYPQTSNQSYGNQQYNFMSSNSAPPTQYQPIPPYSGKPIEEHGLVCAIVSCVLGLFSIVFYFLSIGGLVLGIIGLVQSKKNQDNIVPKVISILGIVFNAVLFVIFLFVVIIFVAAILASS